MTPEAYGAGRLSAEREIIAQCERLGVALDVPANIPPLSGPQHLIQGSQIRQLQAIGDFLKRAADAWETSQAPEPEPVKKRR